MAVASVVEEAAHNREDYQQVDDRDDREYDNEDHVAHEPEAGYGVGAEVDYAPDRVEDRALLLARFPCPWVAKHNRTSIFGGASESLGLPLRGSRVHSLLLERSAAMRQREGTPSRGRSALLLLGRRVYHAACAAAPFAPWCVAWTLP